MSVGADDAPGGDYGGSAGAGRGDYDVADCGYGCVGGYGGVCGCRGEHEFVHDEHDEHEEHKDSDVNDGDGVFCGEKEGGAVGFGGRLLGLACCSACPVKVTRLYCHLRFHHVIALFL